jgi:hypothetical protein
MNHLPQLIQGSRVIVLMGLFISLTKIIDPGYRTAFATPIFHKPHPLPWGIVSLTEGMAGIIHGVRGAVKQL